MQKIITFFIMFTLAFAGNTGKICGKVTDKSTGEPLIGVNVMLVETSIGTATDGEGEFILLNIPVGEYDVKAERIGYAIVINKKILITSDLTTTVNFNLSTSVIEGEIIEVFAEKPAIQMDLTSSQKTITSTDMMVLPVENIDGAISMSAGVVEDENGNMHFRGGRDSEVVYLFDGISLNDPLTGNPNDSNVPMLGVSELAVISGGFSAEYGDAQSGVINVTGSEGSNRFRTTLRYTTSSLVSNTFNDNDPEELKKFEFLLSGPLFKDISTFSFSGDINEDYGRFNNEYQDLLNFSGKITYNPNKNIKFHLSGLYSLQNMQDGYDHEWNQTINEDKMADFVPLYIKALDGTVDEIKNGVIDEKELLASEETSFYSDWWQQTGLQSEDSDNDNVLDIYYLYEPYTDWNNNDQWDYFDSNGNGLFDADEPHEWFDDKNGDGFHNFLSEPFTDLNYNEQWDYIDLNGNGIFDNDEPHEWFDDKNGDGLYNDDFDWDADGDINKNFTEDENEVWDRLHEDLNNDGNFDSEGVFDSWYGNGILDTEDLNFNGVLDHEPFIDINEDGLRDENEPFDDCGWDGLCEGDAGYPGPDEGEGDGEYNSEDLNRDNYINTEDVDRNKELSTFSMFERLPWWETESYLITAGVNYTISPRTYFTFTAARYMTSLTQNNIERINEDVDYDENLDHYLLHEPYRDENENDQWDEGEWYSDLDSDGEFTNNPIEYDNYTYGGDGDIYIYNTLGNMIVNDGDPIFNLISEDKNGNGQLDSHNSSRKVWGVDDKDDMFHDENNDDIVDESYWDRDGNGVIDEHDYITWDDMMASVSEGFQVNNYYAVSPNHPYTYNRDHWHHDKKITDTYKFNFVTQFNENNKLQTGFEVKNYDLSNHDTPDRYGYAELYNIKPTDISVFISNKMEYEGIIVNAGLRLEHFEPSAKFPLDESDPKWDAMDEDDWTGTGINEPYSSYRDEAGLYIHDIGEIKDPVSGESTFKIAPRLGISHRITDHSMLYFNYGRNYQRPRLDFLFRNLNYSMRGGFPIVGNPTLDPEMTTSYEVGVRNEVRKNLVMEFKGFYKDIYGLTDTRPVYWTVSDWYSTYYNRDYGNVRGAEFIVSLRPPGMFYGEFNYTYSIAKGKSSSQNQGYLNQWAGKEVPTWETYLDWDQRHTVNADINFHYKNTLSTLVINYGSGTRFTKPGQGAEEIENTEVLPWTLYSDFKFNYFLEFGPVKTTIYMIVSNPFNHRNIRMLSDDRQYYTYETMTDAYESGEMHYFDYMSQVDLNHDGVVDRNKENPEMGIDLDPSVYSDKRRFRIGVSFEF